MNNYQWLLQMDGAERKAWFDAEHVETEERALDGDTEPENADSRERLEADVLHHVEDIRHKSGWTGVCANYGTVIEWLDRQAAITERETTKRHELFCEKCEAESDKQIAELKAERVKLRSQICKLEDDLVGTSDERDNWKANCEDWKKHARAAENACYETMLEREDYRKKFGKCIDYADAIHALMDDEGMA